MYSNPFPDADEISRICSRQPVENIVGNGETVHHEDMRAIFPFPTTIFSILFTDNVPDISIYPYSYANNACSARLLWNILRNGTFAHHSKLLVERKTVVSAAFNIALMTVFCSTNQMLHFSHSFPTLFLMQTSFTHW